MDDSRLAALGKYTPEGTLTPGFGDHYLFFVGRDDVHGILLSLLTQETLESSRRSPTFSPTIRRGSSLSGGSSTGLSRTRSPPASRAAPKP